MKTRIITAIIAILIAIPFVYLGGYVYALGIGIVAVLAFKEVNDLKVAHSKIPFIPLVISIISLLMLVYTNFDGMSVIYGTTYIRVILPAVGLLLPCVFYKNDKYTTRDAFYLIGWIIFLGIGFNTFILVRDQGLPTFIYLISIPIITDTFAYFCGCAFGKHKMAPKISPKKTWEGTICGSILGTVLPSIIYFLTIGNIDIFVIIATLLLSGVGQIGDLLLSKVKRENNTKDFSNLMPGHGGILDRFDSTLLIFMTYIFLITILY